MFMYVEGEIITCRVHMSHVEKHVRCIQGEREALLQEEEGSGLGEGWAWG